MFLANYGDTLTDADLPAMINRAREEQSDGKLPGGAPELQLYVVSMKEDGRVRSMEDVMGSDICINGGYFILRREFLDQPRPGEDVVGAPLQRLLAADQVLGSGKKASGPRWKR
jgi:glucose-1-phosphate cytidylyltransferase